MDCGEYLLKLDPSTGLVRPLEFIASPNCDARPAGVVIDVLVVHCISLPPGEYGGPFVEQLVCNRLNPDDHACFSEICHMRVSAHFFIRRTGNVTQFVPTSLRAWHAGQSCFGDRSNVNDFSIGIELEGTDDTVFTDVQYESLVQLSRILMAAYPDILRSNLVAHSDIAPGRKTDPGVCFDWDRYLQGI